MEVSQDLGLTLSASLSQSVAETTAAISGSGDVTMMCAGIGEIHF